MVESGETRSVHSVAHADRLLWSGCRLTRISCSRRSPSSSIWASLPDGMTQEEAQRRAVKGIAQGPAEDALEDGNLDDPVLLRCADLRGGRARAGLRRAALQRVPPPASEASVSASSRARPSPPCPGVPRDGRTRCFRRRALCLAPRRRAPPVEPRDDRAPAARRPPRRLETYEQYSPAVNDERRALDLRGLLRFSFPRTAGPARRGRAGEPRSSSASTGAMSLGSTRVRRTRRSRSR